MMKKLGTAHFLKSQPNPDNIILQNVKEKLWLKNPCPHKMLPTRQTLKREKHISGAPVAAARNNLFAMAPIKGLALHLLNLRPRDQVSTNFADARQQGQPRSVTAPTIHSRVSEPFKRKHDFIILFPFLCLPDYFTETPMTKSRPAVLSVKNIAKSFGGLKAVNGCSFSIPKGSITGLIGPNGAGKTTMFNLMAGALSPSSGQIYFGGRDITSLSPDKLFHLGLVRSFQIPHEFTRLSVLDNLKMVYPNQSGEQIYALFFRSAMVQKQEKFVEKRADEVLEFLSLSHLRNERAGNLSGGQLKLLELGRTMMTDPKLVLLDEPAAGVNRTLLKTIKDSIRTLNQERGYSFIIIEHDMDMIAELCNPVICMAEGRVMTEGTIEQVRNNPKVLEAYLGESQENA